MVLDKDAIPTVKDLMTLTLKSEPTNIKQGYTNSKIIKAFAVHNQRVIVDGLIKVKRIEDEDKFESLFTIEDKNTI